MISRAANHISNMAHWSPMECAWKVLEVSAVALVQQCFPHVREAVKLLHGHKRRLGYSENMVCFEG